MPDLGTFRPEFEKNIVVFEISSFELFKVHIFMLKKTNLNLGPNLFHLDIFWEEFEKNCCHTWN